MGGGDRSIAEYEQTMNLSPVLKTFSQWNNYPRMKGLPSNEDGQEDLELGHGEQVAQTQAGPAAKGHPRPVPGGLLAQQPLRLERIGLIHLKSRAQG